ncbi:putative 26S proteasome regulatory subunit [Tieghemiomyces parasiticus]|uniref:26S proteasome regulatory subunit n=1 Tax=Tieghemiomyces parasiticus TaxID=78921 RepID=A0A9W8DZN4_9FUNG|nr:putative 26S proteasome regulatory subunit [Tieghemiomyces parasiticus]
MEAAQQLLARKDTIERQLRSLENSLHEQGVGLTDPLVDREGFPRSDIDVSAIRLARVQIIELRNDLKNTVGDIEQCLYQLHNVPVGATQSEALATSHDGDLITAFGSLDATNHDRLRALPALVIASLQKPLVLFVLRPSTEQSQLRLELTPSPWEGKGFLGCHILPL